MKIDLKGIKEGLKNTYFPAKEAREEIKRVHDERLEICKTCPYYSPNAEAQGYKTPRADVHCTDCGCNLNYKANCLSCECPQGKWKAEATPMEDAMIKEQIERHGKEGN